MQRIVCSDTRSMAVSMSYMRCFLVSPVAVGGVEIRGDVTLDRVRQRREARVIARAAKIFDRGFREILVIVADRRRHLDVFDVGRPPARRKRKRAAGRPALMSSKRLATRLIMSPL